MTVICPTHNRRRFLPLAIHCFLSQTYPYKEMVIADDGEESAEGLIPDDKRIRYFRLDKKHCTGVKRNFCCEQARGEIIAHFDDDDWNYPGRLADQVQALQDTSLVLTGYRSILFYRLARNEIWRYHSARHVVGASFAYRRTWWERNRFAPEQVMEDYSFFKKARGAVAPLDGCRSLVALHHSTNTSPGCRFENGGQPWKHLDSTALPAHFQEDFARWVLA